MLDFQNRIKSYHWRITVYKVAIRVGGFYWSPEELSPSRCICFWPAKKRVAFLLLAIIVKNDGMLPYSDILSHSSKLTKFTLYLVWTHTSQNDVDQSFLIVQPVCANVNLENYLFWPYASSSVSSPSFSILQPLAVMMNAPSLKIVKISTVTYFATLNFLGLAVPPQCQL